MTRSLGKRALLGAGLALTLPFGLAACGDNEGSDVETVEEDTPTRGGDDLDDTDDSDDMDDDG